MLQTITQSDFNQRVLKAEGLVIVDYGSPTCGPCDMYNTVLEGLSLELSENISFFKINIDKEVLLANQEGILVLPTTKIYEKGLCVKSILGVQSKEDLCLILESLNE